MIVTPDMQARLDARWGLWTTRASRTDPIDPDTIIPIIHGLYRAAGLPAPPVVVTPSPKAMVRERARWARTDDPAHIISDDAYFAVLATVSKATIGVLRACMRGVTATAGAYVYDALYRADGGGWSYLWQRGNLGTASLYLITSARDILSVDHPALLPYTWWEQAAIHGGPRLAHKEFCLVSDFPAAIQADGEGRPHCEDGPSYRWRDGWALYHWHGVEVPEAWIMRKDELTADAAWQHVTNRPGWRDYTLFQAAINIMKHRDERAE